MVQLQTAYSILPIEGLQKKTRGGPKWNDLASNIQKENHGLDFVTIKIEYIGQLRANIKFKQHGLQLLICQMGFRELFFIGYNPNFDRPPHGLQVSPSRTETLIRSMQNFSILFVGTAKIYFSKRASLNNMKITN